MNESLIDYSRNRCFPVYCEVVVWLRSAINPARSITLVFVKLRSDSSRAWSPEADDFADSAAQCFWNEL